MQASVRGKKSRTCKMKPEERKKSKRRAFANREEAALHGTVFTLFWGH